MDDTILYAIKMLAGANVLVWLGIGAYICKLGFAQKKLSKQMAQWSVSHDN